MSTSPTTLLDEKKAKAEALKLEGNAFYAKGQHREAYTKFTEAIKLDGKNVILYANRSAVSLALKEYLDAGTDARQATKLDPTFSKGWGRLAKASYGLLLYDQSIEQWKKALACLPESDLSPSDQKLKEQYEEGLKSAEKDEAKLLKESEDTSRSKVLPITDTDIKAGRLPWQRALAMEKNLSRETMTSAWVIMNAYRDFTYGLEAMKTTKRVGEHIFGRDGALQDLTNGLLLDDRCFYMEGGAWLDSLQDQVRLEGDMARAWGSSGPRKVQEEAMKRFKREGWGGVRPAIAYTVRNWILQGHIVLNALPDKDPGKQLIDSAVAVLDWGEMKWKNVPHSDRGVVFQKTFMRGVKRMQLNAHLKTYERGSNVNDQLDKMDEMAQAILDEVTANPITNLHEIDPGFWLSYMHYPRATAFSTMGFCEVQRAEYCMTDGEDKAQAMVHYANSATFYTLAAKALPSDDEMHPFYLKIALECYWHQDRPIKDLLPLCAQIQASKLEAEKIWGYSAFFRSLMPTHMEQVARFERQMFQGLLDETYTLETPSRQIPLL